MVYRIGNRLSPRLPKAKVLLAGSFVLLILAISGGVYANTQNYLHFPLIQRTHPARLVSKAISSIHHSKTSSLVNAVAAKVAVKSRTGSTALPVATVGLASPLREASCTGLFSAPIANLSNAITPELRKLDQYDTLCNGNLTQRTSFFAPTPSSVAAAQADAADMATRLKDYASFGVSPLVILEPDDDKGNDLDLAQYAAGAYDSALNSYFSDLKSDGISDDMMGMWVILPEGNIPVWTSVAPATFVADVIKTIQFQRDYFPNAQDSILLNSETYPSASSWTNGSYSSLLPYVSGIPKGMITSFGLEGFPWSAPNNQSSSTLYNPSVYLRVDLAAQAAAAIGTNNIWLNTGTFNQMYANNPAETVTDSPQIRQMILNGVVAQAQALQAQGYNVSLHLFAQDKADTAEAIDWSYWQTEPGSDANTQVFTTFVHDLAVAHIPLWLFDTYNQ